MHVPPHVPMDSAEQAVATSHWTVPVHSHVLRHAWTVVKFWHAGLHAVV